MRAFRRGFLAVVTALATLLLAFQAAPAAHADDTVTISGTLTDKDGPLGGLSVCAEPVNTEVGTNVRRECVNSEPGTGAFLIDGLVPWQYRLVAYGEGYPARYFSLDGSTPNSSDASVLDVTVPLVDRNIVLTKPPLNLSLTPTPKVTGKAKAGSKLTAKPGTWGAGVTLSYQWLRANAVIAGATAPTYKVQPSDGGSKLSVRVTGTKAGYASVSKDSKQTAKVPLSKLKASSPRLSGSAVVGGTLTATLVRWTPGTLTAYQWYANGKAISGATGNSLVLEPAVAGKAVKVKVTGTKPGYKAVTKISKAKKVK